MQDAAHKGRDDEDGRERDSHDHSQGPMNPDIIPVARMVETP